MIAILLLLLCSSGRSGQVAHRVDCIEHNFYEYTVNGFPVRGEQVIFWKDDAIIEVECIWSKHKFTEPTKAGNTWTYRLKRKGYPDAVVKTNDFRETRTPFDIDAEDMERGYRRGIGR